MRAAARVQAAIEILDDYLSGRPAEQALTQWGRAHRFAGSKDRAALRDLVFDALRCRSSYAWLGGRLSGRGLMIGALRSRDEPMKTVFNGQIYAPSVVSADEAAGFGEKQEMPLSVALDMPEWLLPYMKATAGTAAQTVCAALQERAPVDLRVNTMKASVAEAQMTLAADGIATAPVSGVATALRVTEGARRVSQSTAYRGGLVELQDSASQSAVLRSPLPLGGRVLDFCAGGGGKALAMAAQLGGPVYVHDAAQNRMKDLPLRAARAGADLRVWDAEDQRPFDFVFCDAPCSGSGTWRRAPQAKWDLSPEVLAKYVVTQRAVLRDAATLVCDGGTLVYATCSLLGPENGDQVAWFLETHPAFELREACQLLPEQPGDGFYFSVFDRVQTTKG